MPCASWLHKVLYTAATELLMDADVISDNPCGDLAIQPSKFNQI